MHVQFEKIRYKNILSVGNQFIEIDFQKTKTTMIMGTNGQGKSLLLDAVVFALYGRPHRKINKPQLVNSINKKDLLVELEFSIGTRKYKVRRGMSPAIFEIYLNGELLNKDAASRDYQEYLEKNIIKMSQRSFTQIVILGSATYIPFMQLTTGQRREIIEDLLDIQVFSTMNNLLKERVSSNKEEIKDNGHSITLLETKIETAKEHNAEIEKMKKTEVEKLKSKVAEHLETIEENKEKIEAIESEITDLGNTIKDKSKQRNTLSKINELHYELQLKSNTIEKDVKFYSDHDNCPTCKQGIEHSFKEETVSQHRSKIEELHHAIEQLDAKKKTIEQRIEEISNVEDNIQALHNKANEHRLEVKMTMNRLKTIKVELVAAEKEVEEIDRGKIEEYETDLKALQSKQQQLYDQREVLNIIATMLKDGGIKTSIIRTYIPIMNKIINQYLAEFELFVDFNLDENFNETIKSRFRDKFSFASFSEGEKMRINLSIMFAWRALAKLRNSVSTNLLLLDEILDGASDASGVETIIDILHRIHTKDNVFVISHRGETFGEKFERTIRFEKVKNFTQISSL
jgi:DNA repair exonuclease SbcCD ATPase subunit